MLKNIIQFLNKYIFEELLLLVVGSFLFVQHIGLTIILTTLLFYFIFVLLLNDTFLYKSIKKGLGDIMNGYLYLILILIFITLFFIWHLSFEAIIFFTLFLTFVLYAWDSRIIATGALVSLASCPILLIYKQDAYAEHMAIYAYYFLVMTVILQIIEYKRHPELYKDDQNEEK